MQGSRLCVRDEGCCSKNIPHPGRIKENEMGGSCGTYGGEERCIQGLERKYDRKGPLLRHRRRCEDNIKASLQEIECKLDWINLAQDRDRR